MAALHGRHTGTAVPDRHSAGKAGMETVEMFAWRRLHECAARSQPVGHRTAWTAQTPRVQGPHLRAERGFWGPAPVYGHAFVAPWDLDCLSWKKKQQHLAVCVRGMNPAGWGCDDKAGRFVCSSLVCLPAGRHQRAARPVRRNAGDSGGDTNQMFLLLFQLLLRQEQSVSGINVGHAGESCFWRCSP